MLNSFQMLKGNALEHSEKSPMSGDLMESKGGRESYLIARQKSKTQL